MSYVDVDLAKAFELAGSRIGALRRNSGEPKRGRSKASSQAADDAQNQSA